MNKKFWTIAAVVYIVTNAIAAIDILRKNRQDQAIVEARKREFDLDMLAIERTGAIVTKRAARGQYKYSTDMDNDFQQELEFQKIAVREEK